MQERHLSDFEIQEYLDKIESPQLAEIERHMGKCPVCQAACANYLRLYGDLESETGFDFSPSFERDIMDRLQPVSPKKSPNIFANAVFIVIASIFPILLVVYFCNFTPELGGAFQSIIYYFSRPIFSRLIKESLALFNGNLSSTISAFVALAAISLLDRLYVKSRRKATAE
jgi:hypothetical protein